MSKNENKDELRLLPQHNRQEFFRKRIGELNGKSIEMDYHEGKDDSDIDVVVLAKNVFSNNASSVLSVSQFEEFNRKYSDSEKTIPSFKDQLYARLNGKPISSGYFLLKKGCKSIKYNEDGDYGEFVPVDIVPAFEYRNYSGNNGIYKENQIEGIKILDSCKNSYIINYPKLHKKNGEDKNSPDRTRGNYKETIRIFKQIKKYLIDENVLQEDLMPSYALECLLYNVPDSLFKKDLVERVDFIIEWLLKNVNTNFIEQNEMYHLFLQTIKIENAKIFIEKCKWLSDNW